MIIADREYGSADIELDLAYDKAGRVTSVAENAGTSYTIGYTYVVNAPTDYREVTYPDGRVIREVHDPRGRGK